MNSLHQTIRSCLTDDLRKPEYQGHPNPMHGHCYVASEALFHLTKGALKPHHVWHQGFSHWYLASKYEIVDLTVDQFMVSGMLVLPNYSTGKRAGFLTKEPSKRCRILLDRVDKVLSDIYNVW